MASLLKPINDTRLYEKLGLSLSKIPGASIHIVAYEALIPNEAPSNVFFYPIFRFKRLSADRITAQYKFYRTLQRIKPQLIVVSTHELLLPSMLYKAKHNKVRIVYDIRENYSLNLTAQQNYTWPLKHLLALAVRGVESMTTSYVDHFLLAERSYAQELPFLRDRYTFIENKYKAKQKQSQPNAPVNLPAIGTLRLLYSGTIAEEYGVWEAIELAKQMTTIRPELRLTIIGYCANRHTLARLQETCRMLPFVELIGGDKLVPHRDIVQQIQMSHVGLLPYRPNPSTFRCIPTKLYEYMAHALPILIQQNPLWAGIVEGNDAGLSIDFSRIDVKELCNELAYRNFYRHGIPASFYWESEETKLIPLVTALLSQV